LFAATAYSINTYQAWNASITVYLNPLLTVNLLGTGAGTVTPDSGSLSWAGNVGTNYYASNSQVILTATPSAGSSFDGWSGACTNTSGTCTVAMNSNKSASATFTVIPNARIGTTPYGTLNNAYNAITTSGTIEAKALTFTENLTIDRAVSVTLKGGYADDYGSIAGLTVLNGVLRVSIDSNVAVSNIAIRGL
jgi:hypothetical protein